MKVEQLKISLILVFMLFCGCTKSPQMSSQSSPENALEGREQLETKSVADAQSIENENQKKVQLREIRESLYFFASLERESLRLILKNSSIEKTTLFSVLSYAFETFAGVKKSPPQGLDCSRFRIESLENRVWTIWESCQKNEKLMATITKDRGGMGDFQTYRVEFNVKEWSKIIGFSAALSSKPINCRWSNKDKKVHSADCSDWVFTTSTTRTSSEEIRLTTFDFNRESALQLRLIGGLFLDLVQRRKIEVIVPLQGKIKLIEKEIEVKDDFAQYVIQENSNGQKNEKINEKGEQSQNSENEKVSQQQKEDDYQKLIQVENGNSSENQEVEVPKNQSQGGEPIIEAPKPENRGR